MRRQLIIAERAGVGEVSLERPSEDEVARQTAKTKEALAVLISGASAAQKPSLIKKQRNDEPTFVKYTPADQFGQEASGRQRIIRIQNQKQDPMEPPKFKHKKIPRGPPTPPRPIMHSPPRKLTAEDQAAWRIPPAVSSWKNPKGYTRGIDKLLVARPNIEDVQISDKFSQFSEALFTADRVAREEVKQRVAMQQKLAEKEKQKREENLRMLAQQARMDRGSASRRRSSAHSRSSRSRSGSFSDSSQDSELRERERARRERHQENQKQMRQSRMGTERRMQMLAREQNRDISEKIALGLAKPTQTSESMYDSRLFNQTSGFDTGFNEDQPYDKPLFAAQDTINSIYRPTQNQDDEVEEDGGATMDKISKANRFEVLGKAAKGFKGADAAEPRSGPVVFERDRDTAKAAAPAKDDDPFGIDDMIRDATGGMGGNGKKRSRNDEEDRGSKRARVDEDEDDD